jgi:hypothetical protein
MKFGKFLLKLKEQNCEKCCEIIYGNLYFRENVNPS